MASEGRSTVYNAGLTKDYDTIVSSENKNLIKEFISYLQSVDKSPQTIKQYFAQLKIWASWNAEYNENIFFIDQKKRHFVRFFSYVQNDLGASGNRVASLRAVLSSFSNFIERILDDDYPTFRNIVKVLEPSSHEPVRKKVVLTIEDVKHCLDRLVENKKFQAAAFLAVAVSCGARRAEIIQFTLNDFAPHHLVFNGAAYETHPVRSKGKGKAGHVVSKLVFTNIVDLNYYLELWMIERERLGIKTETLFVATRDGYPPASVPTANAYAKTISHYMGQEIYNHAFRHLCCTHLLKQGVPKEVVQQIFRWKTDQVPTYDDRDKNEELAKFMINFNRQTSV